MKKFLSMLVMAAFMLTLVVGCSGTPTTPAKPPEVKDPAVKDPTVKDPKKDPK